MKRLRSMMNLKSFALKCLFAVMLAALGCIAALSQTPAAFGVDYYFLGGSGTWPADSVPSWDTTSNSWNSPLATDPATTWVNDNTSVGRIGYLGSGGNYGGSGYSQTTPSDLVLTSPVIMQELYFGLNPTNSNHSYYRLTGQSVTIGDGMNPGKITLDFNNVGGNGWALIQNDLTVPAARI